MVEGNPKREIYCLKKDVGQPVKFTNLNSVPYGVLYFNFNKGSRMEDIVEISFKCPIRPQVKLLDLKSKPKYTTHAIVEQIKWIN